MGQFYQGTDWLPDSFAKQQRRPDTSNEDEFFRAPRWAGILNEKLNTLLATVRRNERLDIERDQELKENTVTLMRLNAEVLRAVKALRNDLQRPTIKFEVGKPKDKEI